MTVAIVVGPLAVATEGELKEEGRREGEGGREGGRDGGTEGVRV